MVSIETSDLKKIGLTLIGFGITFKLVGVLLFFNKNFLEVGHVLLLLGVIMTKGPKSTLQFFITSQNRKGSILLVVGFCIVVVGWPMIGTLVETYVLVVLSSGLWPVIAMSLRNMPILGWMLQMLQKYYVPPRFRCRMTGKRLPV